MKAYFAYAVATGRITTNPFGNKKTDHGNSEKTVAKIGINPITLSQSLNGNPTLSRLLEVPSEAFSVSAMLFCHLDKLINWSDVEVHVTVCVVGCADDIATIHHKVRMWIRVKH